MTLASIFVFALVVTAGTSVALVWLIFATRRDMTATRSFVEQQRRLLAAFSARLQTVEKQSPVNLAGEVASLAELVARLRAIQMRFQGRFDQYMGQERREGDMSGEHDVHDEKWRALMALQGQGPANGGT